MTVLSPPPAPATTDLFDLAPSAMVVSDRQGHIVRHNQAFARLVGWPANQAPPAGKLSTLLSRPSQFVFASQVLPPLHLTGAVQEIELDIIDQAGLAHAVLLSGVRLGGHGNGNGEEQHYFSLAATKARRAYEREQLLARSQLERKQEYLDLAEKLARVGHWHVDLTRRESFWSPEVYVIHGQDPQAVPGPTLEKIISLYHAEDIGAVRAIIGASIASHQPFAFQKRLAATPERGERIVEVSGLVESGPTGQATGVFGVVRDVTEAVKAQRDLETSEARYRLLAENVPGMIAYWDATMICQFANRAYLEWFGRTPEAMLGCSMQAIMGDALFALNRPYIDGVLSGVDQAFERAIVKPSGKIGYTWANYVPDIDGEGRIRGFYALVTDVTELKQRNLADQAANALQSAVLSSTNYIVIATDPGGKVTVFNAAAEAALGYRADEVIGKHTPALWHAPEEVNAPAIEPGAASAGPNGPGFGSFLDRPHRNGVVAGEFTFIRKDGSRFPVRLSGSRILDTGGQVTGFLGVAEDITDRRNAEMALRTSEETFRAAMENAPIGMTIQDPTGGRLRVNKALAQLLGYSQEELLALDFRAITHPEDLARSDALVARLMAGDSGPHTVEKRYLRKDGSAVWAQLNISAVRRPDGSPQYFITQVQDITERREVERVKNELISTVSHELRTPVTSIRGSLGLLAGSMADLLPPDVQKLIAIANKNSERLNLLVNDMLDIDKIASGNMQFTMARCPLDALIGAAIEDNTPYARGFGVVMVNRVEATGLHVEVDAARFQQVMSNLLSNAAKFSPAGGQVEVTATVEGAFCRIAIKDQGKGIPAAFAPHVFAKFSQADISATRRHYGSGLGLHISREIVERMGGSIGFERALAVGATFWITLRLA